MIYLDSAALVKLVHRETESLLLEAWLAEGSDPVRLSSSLAEVEVERTIRRHAPHAMHRLAPVLGTLELLDVDPLVRSRAAALAPPTMRSLDAIHLASALELGRELAQFVSYDRRLLAAAAEAGLTVASPGQQYSAPGAEAQCSQSRSRS